MRDEVRKSDDHGVLNAAVIVSLLTAVLVELRHRRLVADIEVAPWAARVCRDRFLLETWVLTGICLLVLAISQTGIH
jgi:hypothetical protein